MESGGIRAKQEGGRGTNITELGTHCAQGRTVVAGIVDSSSFALIANQIRLWIETKLKVAALLGLAINARRTAGPELGDDRSAWDGLSYFLKCI